MPLVKILPPELRNKIAAGEVIERPASVVKELIENSIDAESTDITVEILHGGKGLIKVADNGTGMDRDDALLSLERHATSKLKNEEDLSNIKTLGFRGEALPSIASVSRMRLITGLRNIPLHPSLRKGGMEGVGISIEIHGGEVKETRDFPSHGTSIEVRDLFFNTPARKKFLKSDGTELFHIIDTVTKEALSHWEVGFRLLTEKQETMNLPVALSPKERIIQIYGLEFVEGLLEVNPPSPPFGKGGMGGLRMTAYVTKGENFRNNRAHQFIFINRRPVRDQPISHAVYKAYEGILPHDRHPMFFLFVDLDPKKIDFNVHPTKREVRFANNDEIHRFVSNSIREAIRRERSRYIASFAESPDRVSVEKPAYPNTQDTNILLSSDYALNISPEKGVSESIDLLYRPSLPFIYLGDTFIAAAGKGGLTLIDHHAAHERILYENLLRGLNLNTHPLLFPRQIKLSHKEYKVILDNRYLLYEMGMEIDDFGHDTLIVRSLPEEMKEADLRGILVDVAETLMEGTQPFTSLREALAAKIACHGSVRGKEILHQEEFQRLLHALEQTENPDQCPHGRPTRIFISLDDLKKMFKRK